MIATENVLGLVLAGGRSERMGQDKALLEFAGQTLLARAVKLLRSIGLAKVVVSGDYCSYECVADIKADLGPLGGIYSVLFQIEHLQNAGHNFSHLLVLAVDMPLMTKAPLLELLQQEEAEQGIAYCDSLFPLLLCCNESNLRYLQEQLEGRKKRSIYAMLHAQNFKLLDVAAEQQSLFLNSNTPEQWQRLCVSKQKN